MNRDVFGRLLNWWEGKEQDRPCLLVSCPRKPEIEQEPKPENLDAYWMDPASHVRRAENGIRNRRYFGEALPFHYVDFGGLALCGLQGCAYHYTDKSTIWMDVKFGSLQDSLSASADGNLPFSRCVHRAFEGVSASLAGQALVGPYGISGPVDNLAGMIGTENVIYAMYDEPELLERAIRRQLELWVAEFSYMINVLKPSPVTPMTGWHGVPAPGSTFPIQEDIGYMLDPENYKKFCIPGIRAMAECQDYSFFHLDGPGALTHLNALLDIRRLNVIQWLPGEGQMQAAKWVDVIRKITLGGKGCQLFVEPEEIGPLVGSVGPKGLLLVVNTDEERALRLAEQYGLEENSLN